jgi:hypothetical protein
MHYVDLALRTDRLVALDLTTAKIAIMVGILFFANAAYNMNIPLFHHCTRMRIINNFYDKILLQDRVLGRTYYEVRRSEDNLPQQQPTREICTTTLVVRRTTYIVNLLTSRISTRSGGT